MFQTLNDADAEERILNDVSAWTHEELMTHIQSKFCETGENHSLSRMKKEK